ncbi:MAG: hypothetical protein CME60_01780 [Halobacteriovoraceae bacterium]|nr:hypothetical protein [Halobacteriovoraceae bacterium]
MNLAEILKNKIEKSPSQVAIGHSRKGRPIHYNFFDYGEELRAYILAMQTLGIKHGDRVAIMGSNSLEWHLTDLSLMMMGAISIPIYPNTIDSEVIEIVENTGADYFFCQDKQQYSQIKKVAQKVQQFILFEEELQTTDIPKNISFLSDLLAQSKNQELPTFSEISKYTSPDDTATIVYTSGTTDISKAVMFPQSALVAFLENIAIFMEGKITTKDCSLSHLPLSHILGRCDSLLHLSLDSHVFFGNGTTSFINDLSATKPSFFITVPRILEKMKERIENHIAAKGLLFKKLYETNRAISKNYHSKIASGQGPSTLEKQAYIYSQKYFFKPIKDQISPHIRFIVSGGAPLSKSLFYFFQDLGIPILEGYGLTETLGPCTFNPFEKPKAASVGIPLPHTEIEIDDDGEILIKSPSIFSQYLSGEYDDAEFTDDGFFKTGDIGHLDEDNYLYITDRKKDLIITSGGKNVAPQKIEVLMCERPHISQFMVVGDKKKYLSGLVGISKENFKELFEDGLLKSHLSVEELASRVGIQELIQMEIDDVNKLLPKYEQIRHFRILPIDITDNRQFMTPSGKVKKARLYNKFTALVDSMYHD